MRDKAEFLTALSDLSFPASLSTMKDNNNMIRRIIGGCGVFFLAVTMTGCGQSGPDNEAIKSVVTEVVKKYPAYHWDDYWKYQAISIQITQLQRGEALSSSGVSEAPANAKVFPLKFHAELTGQFLADSDQKMLADGHTWFNGQRHPASCNGSVELQMYKNAYGDWKVSKWNWDNFVFDEPQ